MNCQCGGCAVCRGEKRPLFPRAAWSDLERLKQRIEQAEVSVMAEERQAQMSFNWARVGFSMAVMVQVGLSAGCFPIASVYGGPPPKKPTPHHRAPAPTATPSAHVDRPKPVYGLPPKPNPTPLQPKSPTPGVTPVDKEPNDVYGLPPKPQATQTAQPLQLKPVVPEGHLTPGPEPTRRIYGMPRRDPK